jgi:prepilin-type processing-associated H-X9-DG protein
VAALDDGMKVRTMKKQSARLTVSGALLLLVSVAIFVVVLSPAMKRDKRRPLRVYCSAQLKQVTLGFALWANEHQGKLPMEVPVSAGGCKEDALAGRIVPNFTVAEREIGDPRLLVCPSDKKRKQATTFANLTTNNISYFLNADATYLNQAQIIAGDRDVTLGGSLPSPGLLPIPDPSLVDWGSVLHYHGGNVAFVDGSVHQVTRAQLRKVLEIGSTNRLIIP